MPQSTKPLRTIIPIIVFGVAVLLVSMVIFAPGSDRTKLAANKPVPNETSDASAPAPDDITSPDVAPTVDSSESDPSAEVATPAAAPAATLTGLHLKSHAVDSGKPALTLGSLDDPDNWSMQLVFQRAGAGVAEISFANIWYTAAANRQAEEYFSAIRRGETPAVSLPVDDRYVLNRSHELVRMNADGLTVTRNNISVLSAHLLKINDVVFVDKLSQAEYWEQISPGHFVATVLDAKDQVVALLTRKWELGSGFDITLHQHLENKTTAPIDFIWVQYGPASLDPDRARYMDRRRFRFGYEFSDKQDPAHVADVIAGGEMLLEMTDAIETESIEPLWPNEVSKADGFTLSWFAATNRYFGLAVHPLLTAEGGGARSLAPQVEKIERFVQEGADSDDAHVFTYLISPSMTVAAGETHDLSIGLFAGPLKRTMLDDQEPYKTLNMRGLILYQMSSFCAICTFAWLANILIIVLSFLDQFVLFDWGMAIIGLVIIVRTLLHPITRRSQGGMQRFTRRMAKLKPQMDKINQKYGDDPKRKQTEQMKLMREHGVNPLQMLGCLPMFLQMPVWIALYAVLYFAFELRQEPAFWGFFQLFGDWAFLADLSSPDHFFYEFQESHQVLFWRLTGINLLPLLLGVLFFFQQKYMTPPTATLSPEQESQQKIMRVMMIGLFPLMLYSAPSGLTLYILTSSSVGILESRHIRRQVDLEEQEAGNAPPAAPEKKKKVKDPQARAYAKMLERRKVEAKQKQAKNFKKRK